MSTPRQRIVERARGAAAADVPRLVPSESPPVRVAEYRPFPVRHLPAALRPMVEAVAASVGCDAAFAALPGLVVAGAAAGGAVTLSPKKGWHEPPTLFACVVADSGSAKSPSAVPFMAAADLVEDDLEQEYRDAVAGFDASAEAYQADPENHAKPPTPRRSYFAVSDATIERLVENLSTSPRGLLMHRDELSGWFAGFTRYRSSGSDCPAWLSLFDGGTVSYQRRTGTPRDVRVRRGIVSVFGGVQPDVLRGTLSDPLFMASGLCARLVFAMPPRKCVRWSDAEVDPAVEARFRAAVRFLRELPFDPARPGRVGVGAVARAHFVRFHDELAERAEDLDGGGMAAALPKIGRIALRLALVHHCLAAADAERFPDTLVLDEVSMVAGIETAEWFAHEAERVYDVLAERPEDTAARRLAELVRRKDGRITPRDLSRANGRRYPTAVHAEAALDALVAAGLGAWSEETASNRKTVRTLVLTADKSRPTLSDGESRRK